MRNIKLPKITHKIISETVLPPKVLEFHKKVHKAICIEAWITFYLLRNHINSKYKKAIIENIVEVCQNNTIFVRFTEDEFSYCFGIDGFEKINFKIHLTDIFLWVESKEGNLFWENASEDFWLSKSIKNKLK